MLPLIAQLRLLKLERSCGSLPGHLSELKAVQPQPATIIHDPFLPQGLIHQAIGPNSTSQAAPISCYFVVAIAASMSALRAEGCPAPVRYHHLQNLSAAGPHGWEAIGHPMH
ncbi:unnamed protein product [Symbiodinium sp. KB8]|nr:unnamed protein product [Symbiodinium sp. KB8]